MQWIKQVKEVKRIEVPAINIRRLGVGFNALIAKQFGVSQGQYAEVFTNDGCIGFKFSDEPTNDSYLVTQDGGGKRQTNNLFIACGKMLSRLGIQQTSAPLPAIRDDSHGIVFAYMQPQFKHKVSERKAADGETGVYRYLFDNEIVYIGQGVLRERMNDTTRSEWRFDEVEYMVVESDAERFKIESNLIAEFKQMNGRLPFYNRIGGRRV